MFIEVFVQDALTKLPGCKNLTNQLVNKDCEIQLDIYGYDKIYSSKVNVTESTASFTFKVTDDLDSAAYLLLVYGSKIAPQTRVFDILANAPADD